MIRKVLGTVLCVWLACHVHAQTETRTVSSVTDGWTVFHETAEVKIEVKRNDCLFPQEGVQEHWVLLRYTNKTARNLSLSFQEELYYNGVCKTCNKQEYNYNLALAPHQVLEGGCDLSTPYTKRLFVHFLDLPNPTRLTAFRFNELRIQ